MSEQALTRDTDDTPPRMHRDWQKLHGVPGKPWNLVSVQFVQRMELELQSNEHKGHWKDWHPKGCEALDELQWHVQKLTTACSNADSALVKELSADIANIAMKMWEAQP